MNLRNLGLEETAVALAPLGVGQDVARRVFAAVQHRGQSALDNVRGLGAVARRAIEAQAVWPELQVVERRESTDGFVKYLFSLPDGQQVEAVRIPLPDPAATRALRAERERGAVAGLQALPATKYTVCVSSQVGCALACSFCATGKLGAIRNLATWEILAQIRHITREAEHPVRGVVFMGMGEPFLNYDNVLRAARVLSDPAGFAIAAPKISISTAGVVPMIERYTAEGHQYRLVFSLGAPTDPERSLLMPINKRWPLGQLMPAIRAHAAHHRQRATLAYVAIGGRNMSRDHAVALADLIGDLPVKLNLIDVTDAGDEYPRPSREEISGFYEVLGGRGIPIVRRYSGGSEIGAACGTLAATRTGGQIVPAARLVPV